jgi:5-methyltetrahydrofolate--homocysteine methyltransferase
MSGFLDALRSGRVLLMDGAMGTELRRAGLPDGLCGEIWNIWHPKCVRAIHQAYADAGADVLLTNTFQANSVALSRCWGTGPHEVAICLAAAQRIITPFASNTRFILASIGPIVEPSDPIEFPNLGQFSEVVMGISRCGPNFQSYPTSGVLVETCSSPRVRFAMKRTLRVGLPVLLSLTYLHDSKGRITTLSGHAPEWFARRAKGWGVAALGVNCGRDIDTGDTIEIVRRYRQETDLPLFARPNAGTPTQRNGRWVYPHSPERMAARLPELIEAGATMIGGCCGTTPEHIAAFRCVIDALG